MPRVDTVNEGLLVLDWLLLLIFVCLQRLCLLWRK